MTRFSALEYLWGPEWHAGIGYLGGGRTLLMCSRWGAWPRYAAMDRQASRQAKHRAHRGILIEQSILRSLPLWKKTKICTKTHEGTYTGWLSHGLG